MELSVNRTNSDAAATLTVRALPSHSGGRSSGGLDGAAPLHDGACMGTCSDLTDHCQWPYSVPIAIPPRKMPGTTDHK